jgi:putative hemolysin
VDLYKILGIDGEIFEEQRGDSSTLAGFMLEQSGRLLERGDSVDFNGYSLFVEAADKRKIKRVKVTLPRQ